MPGLTPIPIPDGLTIEWEQPEDAQLFWSKDRMHFPHPLTVMDAVLTRVIDEHGINHGMAHYDMPIRAHSRRIWTYYYSSMAPLMLPDDEMEAMAKRSEEKIGAVMAELGERWNTHWLPEVKEHIESFEQFPLQSAPLPALIDHLDDTMRRMVRLWQIHFELAFPMLLSINLYDELYHELFSPDSPLRPYILLQGFENQTVKSGREQWRLSIEAAASPQIRTIFEERAAHEVIPALEALPEGQAFLAHLRDYLAEFGHRGATWGVSYPTWIEDPTPVIRNISDFIAQPDRNPDLEQAALIAERDQLIAEARERLQGYPEAVRKQFEFLLSAAQTSNVLSEDHGYWIDFRAMAAVRAVFVEFGKRFAAAGALDSADDIFHLTPDEIRETARQLPAIDRRAVVHARKAEIEHYRSMDLPQQIGVLPPGPPPDNIVTRTMGKFFGMPPVPSTEAGVLNGAAGSAGVVRGPARILHSLDDADRLQPGDILVAETTAPPWTPLFATAAAVVTDTGGILSHCAVVAREYRIPAVVGTGVATTMIPDGALIEVDGNRGVVRLIEVETASPELAVESLPGSIPAPANFPVTWEHPEDERAFWALERLHWPDPMPPMDFEFMRDAHQSFSWAFAHYGVPLQYVPRLLNYRWYFSVMPSVDDPSEIPALMEAGVQNVEATIARLQDLWTTEWLPEVEQHLAFWKRFDLAGATQEELLAHFEETIARHGRVWQIHFLQTLPVYMAMSSFDDLYQDLFGTEKALDAYRLMQGFENKTTEIGRDLWRLSRQALASPIVRACLEASTAERVISALEESEEGRAFLADLRAFLETNGQRGEKLGVSFPSWIEDPTPAIRQLREYASQPDLDVEAETVSLAAERDRLLAMARESLRGYPQVVVEKFESMLTYAQQATIISEDHTYYIDFGAIYQVRRVVLEIGRRFADAGVLDDTNDIFLLTYDDVREASAQLPNVRMQEIVAERKAQIEHFRTITPPPVLGTPPEGPPPGDPLTRTVGKFFGAPPPAPEGSADALVIRGSSGSSGTAVGVARVITSLTDAERLLRGDILIAPTTAPAWTPLFATAAAVVTDTGGILSHCAVVAREYRIPAVVGTGMATTMIPDGALIEVDGDLGVVRIIG